MGTEKLASDLGLALHNSDLANRKFCIGPHFGPFLSEFPAGYSHFSSKNKLTCEQSHGRLLVYFNSVFVHLEKWGAAPDIPLQSNQFLCTGQCRVVGYYDIYICCNYYRDYCEGDEHVAGQLARALLESGVDEDRVFVAAHDAEALDMALQMASTGDLIVAHASKERREKMWQRLAHCR